MINFYIKRISIARQLHNEFGGNWKYDHHGTWWCDDNRRHVSRVKGCLCDEKCDCPIRIYLYSDEIPKLLFIKI